MIIPADGDFRAFVDVKSGVVDRRIYTDKEIYDLEMKQIFGRGWNFMCHESQIPNPGDFFLNYIGEESVIATRDKKGQLQVLLNTCRHRGNAVCRADQGRTSSFMCTYHGWTYSLEGNLIGVPGYKPFYHEKLDKKKWGLPKAAKVESYKGFVFATMDSAAPSLAEFLGPVGRMGIDLLVARGTLRAVDGIQKYAIGCNWKLAVDNTFDWYHALAHTSAIMLGFPSDIPQNELHQRVVLGEYGHAISGPVLSGETLTSLLSGDLPPGPLKMDEGWRSTPEAQKLLGPVGIASRGHPNIFPNLFVSQNIGSQLCLRLPKGPEKTELWWFTFVTDELDPAQRDRLIHFAIHLFGPAGLFEQEDGENWDQSTRGTRGPLAQRYPLHFGMNNGLPEVKSAGGVSYIDTDVNEHAQLWTYEAWANWMSAAGWDDIGKSRIPLQAAE